MRFNLQTFGCKFSALLMLMTILANWKMTFNFSHYTLREYSTSVFFVGMLFFVCNLTSAIGTYQGRSWGLELGYITIACATIFLSVPYIPLIPMLFSHHTQHLITIIGNISFIAFLIYLETQSSQN
jgi:hypothetical protein